MNCIVVTKRCTDHSLLLLVCLLLRVGNQLWSYSNDLFLSLLQRIILLPKGLGSFNATQASAQHVILLSWGEWLLCAGIRFTTWFLPGLPDHSGHCFCLFLLYSQQVIYPKKRCHKDVCGVVRFQITSSFWTFDCLIAFSAFLLHITVYRSHRCVVKS